MDEELGALISELKHALKDLEKDERKRLLKSAFLFALEAHAWAVLQRLRAELFERRLDLPKTDAEVFSIFQRNGFLDLVEGRRLRQFCESRLLSSRDLSKLDFEGVLAAAEEGLPETRWILKRFATASAT